MCNLCAFQRVHFCITYMGRWKLCTRVIHTWEDTRVPSCYEPAVLACKRSDVRFLASIYIFKYLFFIDLRQLWTFSLGRPIALSTSDRLVVVVNWKLKLNHCRDYYITNGQTISRAMSCVHCQIMRKSLCVFRFETAPSVYIRFAVTRFSDDDLSRLSRNVETI